MAVAWKASSTEGLNTGSSTLAAPLPGSIVSGDFLLLLYTTYEDTNNTLPATPSGWTKLGDIKSGTGTSTRSWTAVYYRVATGSEGSTVSIAQSSSGTGRATFCMSFTGVNTTTPIDAGEWVTTSDDSGSSASKTRTHAVTAAVAGSGLVLYRACSTSQDRTFTSTITGAGGVERYDAARYSSNGGMDPCAYTLDNVSGAQSFDTTASGGGATVACTTEWAIVLRPSTPVVDRNSVGILYG